MHADPRASPIDEPRSSPLLYLLTLFSSSFDVQLQDQKTYFNEEEAEIINNFVLERPQNLQNNKLLKVCKYKYVDASSTQAESSKFQSISSHNEKNFSGKKQGDQQNSNFSSDSNCDQINNTETNNNSSNYQNIIYMQKRQDQSEDTSSLSESKRHRI